MVGLFSYSKPEQLFNLLVEEFKEFHENPSIKTIYVVLFPLYHLREWVCPGGWDAYKDKPQEERTREERFHANLHLMPEYQLVRALCNNAKHFDIVDLKYEEAEGLRVGWARVGDSLGMQHYAVDDIELRDIFWPVYSAYCDFFRKVNTS